MGNRAADNQYGGDYDNQGNGHKAIFTHMAKVYPVGNCQKSVVGTSDSAFVVTIFIEQTTYYAIFSGTPLSPAKADLSAVLAQAGQNFTFGMLAERS